MGVSSLTQEIDRLILDEQVLTLSMRWRRDMLGLRNITERDLNKSYRFAAYKQHTYLEFGYMGPRNRRPLPSCVVWRIRDKFPDPLGNYTDYLPTRI